MLYVFLVDTGTMLTFEMNLAMQSVRDLQDVIAKKCRIPRDKQILLISGGETLDPDSRVCRYASGTETNPLFLFNRLLIESATPPSAYVDYGAESHLEERVMDSRTLAPSYETLIARTELAANFLEVSKEDYMICKHLVFDQHLQHQGWLAAVANLDDVTDAFKAGAESFLQQFDSFLAEREMSRKLISSFPSVIDLLAKIPLLESLATSGLAGVLSASVDNRPKTLLEWINAQDTRKPLEQMMQQCQSALEQFDEATKDSLVKEIESALGQINNDSMKEMRGLATRLSRLELFMQGAVKIVENQEGIFKSIETNKRAALNVGDPTVFPKLCESHSIQLQQLLENHKQLQEIKSKCCEAKSDLSKNMHTRLRWVMYEEKVLAEIHRKIVFFREALVSLKHHLEIISQISESPDTYCRMVLEVVRRKQFSAKFLAFAKTLSDKCSEVHRDELAKRNEFNDFCHHHFLNALFPGLEDIPPPFASKCPKPFDDCLPPLTPNDISFLQSQVPELSESLRLVGHLNVLLIELLPFQTNVTAEDTLDKRKSLPQPKEEFPSAKALEISSQSVEIITTEESRLIALEAFDGTAAAAAAATHTLPIEAATDTERHGERSPNASLEASPELEDNPVHDTFMTADFYIDESMPSSMTELASSKKLAELQGILQDKTAQLELKEREVSDNKRCIDELNAKLTAYEKSAKMMNDVILSCYEPLKQELESVKSSVVMNRSQSLAELDSVQCKITELVKTWNVTSEQIASETQMETSKNFHDNLTLLQVKLDEELVHLQSSVDENEKLKVLLNEKQSQLQLLNDELEKLKEENEASKKMMLELELENEKLRTDHKTVSEMKDNLISDLQLAVDEADRTLKEKENEFKDKTIKLESENAELVESLKKEQKKHEARLVDEITSGLMQQHQQELDAVRKELEQQLNEEKNTVKRLTEDCASYTDKLEEIGKENAAVTDRLAKEHEVEVNKLKEENQSLFKELETSKGSFEELKTEIEQQMKQTDELKQVLKQLKESRMHVESESQTELSKIIDAETQVDDNAGDEGRTVDSGSQTDLPKGVMMESQTELCETISAETQVDSIDDETKTPVDAESQTELPKGIMMESQTESCETISAETQVDCKTPVDAGSQTESCKGVMVDAVFQTEDLLAAEVPAVMTNVSDAPLDLCESNKNEFREQVTSVEEFQTGMFDLRSFSEQSVAGHDEQGKDLVLHLRTDDYLPLQRHDEIVTKLKTQMEEEKATAILTAVEEQRHVNEDLKQELVKKHETEIQGLKSKFEAEKQILFNDALNRAVAERDRQIDQLQKAYSELQASGAGRSEASAGAPATPSTLQEMNSSRFLQSKLEDELWEAKQENLRLQSLLRPLHSSFTQSSSSMTRSVMGQSFVPLPETPGRDKLGIQGLSAEDAENLREKLMQLNITSSHVSDAIMQCASMSMLREGDVAVFVWNAELGHYLAHLGKEVPQHFLHNDCIALFDTVSSELKEVGRWLVGKVTGKDLCLAKKVTNRFRVPVGTKFYRVKIKPWDPMSSQTSSSQKEQARHKDDPDQKQIKDKS